MINEFTKDTLYNDTKIEELILLLKESVERWSDNMINKANDIISLEYAIELISESIYRFGTSAIDIGTAIPPIDPARIETIIYAQKQERSFKVLRINSKYDKSIVVAWKLSKYNSNNSMIIELFSKNYLHICGVDWNLFAYGYHTLENCISAWCSHRM